MFSFVKIVLMNFIRFLFSRSFLKQIIFSLIIVLLASIVTLKWLKSYTNHGSYVEVPNLLGLSANAADITLKKFDLVSKIQDSSNYSPKYASGAVIEQEPIFGSKVKNGRKIYLILNPSNYKKVLVPSVVRKTFRQAKPALETLGFRIGEIKYVDDLGKDVVVQLLHNNKVIKPGDLIRKASKIDIVVGNGNRNIN